MLGHRDIEYKDVDKVRISVIYSPQNMNFQKDHVQIDDSSEIKKVVDYLSKSKRNRTSGSFGRMQPMEGLIKIYRNNEKPVELEFILISPVDGLFRENIAILQSGSVPSLEYYNPNLLSYIIDTLGVTFE